MLLRSLWLDDEADKAKARAEYTKKKAGAIMLMQRLGRKWKAMRIVRQRKAELEAVTKIQLIWKSSKSYRLFRKVMMMNRMSKKIQRKFRWWSLRVNTAARRIQKFWWDARKGSLLRHLRHRAQQEARRILMERERWGSAAAGAVVTWL